MTETTDGVQELNEQDLQKVTGGLKWWGNTAEDYSKYKMERHLSFKKHTGRSTWELRAGNDAAYQNQMAAAEKSKRNMAWADKKIAQL